MKDPEKGVNFKVLKKLKKCVFTWNNIRFCVFDILFCSYNSILFKNYKKTETVFLLRSLYWYASYSPGKRVRSDGWSLNWIWVKWWFCIEINSQNVFWKRFTRNLIKNRHPYHCFIFFSQNVGLGHGGHWLCRARKGGHAAACVSWMLPRRKHWFLSR